MISKKHEEYFWDWGAYFGYPECCVRSFVHMIAGRLGSPGKQSPFYGTGYVPCSECLETKTKEQLEHHIRTHRVCPTPFPDDGEV